MLDLQRQEIKNPVGILKDPNPSDIPLNAWTDGRNVRFKAGKVSKTSGHETVFGGMPGDRKPLYAMPYLTENTPFWFFGFGDRIFRTSGFSWQDVTRNNGAPVNYSASTTYSWNGGFSSGVAIMNNGLDVPQAMRPQDTYFKDLEHWPANYRARVVRPFKNYLIALNITKDSVQQPTVVKWSSPADPGNVPFTWDVTDPTNDAGEAPLADTAGALVDGKKLRDQFILYKEDSVYSMRYVGGTYIFAFQQLFDDVGMLSPNCVAEFDGKHFVVGQGDVYVHNGVQKNSVIDKKMKDYLFQGIKSGGIRSVFVVPDYSNTEMWICFQSTGATADLAQADRAVIWNWQEDTWTIRDLPNVFYGTYGVVDPREEENWDSDARAWDTDTTVWGSSTYNPAKTKMLLISYEDKAAYVIGETSLFNREVFKSRIEKTDIYNGDDLRMKNVTSITPHIRGDGTCDVYVGASDLQDSPVEWNGPYKYNIGKDHKIDCRVIGRYVGVRFEFESRGSWDLNGYTIEYTPQGGKR